MVLKNYQKKAISKMLRYSAMFEEDDEEVNILLHAPTGSGKTIMMSDFIKKHNEIHENYLYIWITVAKGNIHLQSLEKMNTYFRGKPPCKLLKYDTLHEFGTSFNESEVIFISWDSLNVQKTDKQNGSNLRKDSERTNFDDLILNYKLKNKKIMLIIDESHRNKLTVASQSIIDLIKPEITIDVTATPLNTYEYTNKVQININEVRKEEMVVEELIFNPHGNIDNEPILNQAINQTRNLATIYKTSSINVNPLCLIQVNNGVEGTEEIEFVKKRLLAQNYEPHEIIVWTSNVKEDLNNTPISIDKLAANDNHVKYIIFKEALTEGWDCPRAQILVKLRPIRKSKPFEIQTVGRLFRMPEQKYYDDSRLNKSYIFTNDKDAYFDIIETQRPPILSEDAVIKVEGAFNIPSYFSSRKDYNDLNYKLHGEDSYIEIIKKYFKKLKEQETKDYNSIDKSHEAISQVILDEVRVKQENLTNVESSAFRSIESEENYIKQLYNNVLVDILKDLEFNVSRSKAKLDSVVFECIERYLGVKIDKVHSCLLVNKEIQSTISTALAEYKEKEAARLSNYSLEEPYYLWNPVEKKISSNSLSYHRNVYEKIENKVDSDLELKFQEYLDDNEKVLYWYRNGVNKKEFLGIKYTGEDGKIKVFYPDYVAKSISGIIYIMDTKGQMTLEDLNLQYKYFGVQTYLEYEVEGIDVQFMLVAQTLGMKWKSYSGKSYNIQRNSNIQNWAELDIK